MKKLSIVFIVISLLIGLASGIAIGYTISNHIQNKSIAYCDVKRGNISYTIWIDPKAEVEPHYYAAKEVAQYSQSFTISPPTRSEISCRPLNDF